MNTIVHKINIIKSYLIMYFKEKMIFPFESVFTVFSFILRAAEILLFWQSINNAGIAFPGWGQEKIMFFISLNFLNIAIDSFNFGYRDLEYDVSEGQFDVYMTKGVNPFLLLKLERMNFLYIFLHVVISIPLLIYCAINFKIDTSLFLISVIVSIFASFTLSTLYAIFSLLAFKLGRVYMLREMVFSFMSFQKYPTDIFPRIIYDFFFYIIPLGLISTIPTKIAFGEIDPVLPLVIAFSFALVSAILMRSLQKKALSMYKGTGN
ncbi:MAG: ABC-2 family transporter protein [Firmicutes bacterium]|nr:ABC transporter permease [Ezakiella sp.]MDD7761547.1 ABC-2 family transporter protein [Bacillota bacterium]